MEYVHTVLVQIAANRVGDAERLFDELDAHRDFASTQRGFLGMRVTRTAHPEGDVQVVVETRWSSNNAMADYSALPNNAVSIVESHQDLLVPGSLQVHRMQAERAEAAEAPTRMYDRLALALFVPAGILAFALLVIYGLSRIYLSIPNEWATVMAAVIALAVLGAAWYFASNPSIPRWQWLGAAGVSIAALAIGGTAAALYDEEHKEVHAPPTQAPPNGGGTPAPPPSGELVLNLDDNFFQFADGGEENPTITVTSGTTISLSNVGAAVHNMHVSSSSGEYADAFCTAASESPCSDPAQMPGGSTGEIVIDIEPGEYAYRCDFHVLEMNGTLIVE